MKTFHLYNRYHFDITLSETGNEQEFKLGVPEPEMKWIRIIYDSDEDATDKIHAVDPSGGPFVALGANRLSLHPDGSILLSAHSIKESDDKTGFIIRGEVIENG